VDEPLTLANVVAHPDDDDAYGIAGTVALHADDPLFRFVLVHATDGGEGHIREGFPATRETLGAIRRQEDEAAWRALGRPPDRHVGLDLPDGGLDRIPQAELEAAVGVVLDEEQPMVVGTFGPDGTASSPPSGLSSRGHPEGTANPASLTCSRGSHRH
jgi:N-acetyl-1-D-myo-inositol-2-amino-2-deoxy-alpha-D-glucopyranoside deacetylase